MPQKTSRFGTEWEERGHPPSNFKTGALNPLADLLWSNPVRPLPRSWRSHCRQDTSGTPTTKEPRISLIWLASPTGPPFMYKTNALEKGWTLFLPALFRSFLNGCPTLRVAGKAIYFGTNERSKRGGYLDAAIAAS